MMFAAMGKGLLAILLGHLIGAALLFFAGLIGARTRKSAMGDGKIFVYNVENVVKVRTGEEGYDALQDEDNP